MKHFSVSPLYVVILLTLSLLLIQPVYAGRGGGKSPDGNGENGPGKTYQNTAPVQQQSSPEQPVDRKSLVRQLTEPGVGKGMFYGFSSRLLGGILGDMFLGKRGRENTPGWGGSGMGLLDIAFLLVLVGIVYMIIQRIRERKARTAASSGGGYVPHNYRQSVYDVSSSEPLMDDPVSIGIGHIMSTDPSFSEDGFKETARDMLLRVQEARMNRDLEVLKPLLSSPMYGKFQGEVNRHISEKRINRLENVTIREIGIVDAVQDMDEECVTVRFLADLLDYTVDETTNRVVSGNAAEPAEFLEYWTFTRKAGDKGWVLTEISPEKDRP